MEKNWFKESEEALREDYKSSNLGVSEADEKAAQDAFWANTKKRLLDIDNFHKGYDKEIDKVKLFTIFNDDGRMKHRGTYGDIKKLAQTLPITKALKKFWACQFVDYLLTPAEFEDMKRAEEERRAREKAEKEVRKTEQEKEKDEIVAKLDKKVYKEYDELTKDIIGDGTPLPRIVDANDYYHHMAIKFKATDGIYSHILSSKDHAGQVKEAAEYLNNEMKIIIDRAKKEKAYLESVKDRPEYEMRKLNGKLRYNEGLLFIYNFDNNVLVDDGKSISDKDNKDIDTALPTDAKLEATVYSIGHDSHSTRQSSTLTKCISLVDNISKEVSDYLDLDKQLKIGQFDDTWGYHKTEEVPEADIVNDDRYYKADNFNRWLKHYIEDYPTD